MDRSKQFTIWRRSLGPWLSQFEKDACSPNHSDIETEVVQVSSCPRNSQGLLVKSNQECNKRNVDRCNSARNKFRYNPAIDEKIKSNPHRTVFIARLDFNTTEETLFEVFGRYGSIRSLRLVTDTKTGKSKGYAFVEFTEESETKTVLRETKDERLVIDGRKVLIDRVRAGVIPSWLPRRLGGGLGHRQRGTQRFAWKLPYFGDASRIDQDEILRKQKMWLEHNRRSMKSFS